MRETPPKSRRPSPNEAAQAAGVLLRERLIAHENWLTAEQVASHIKNLCDRKMLFKVRYKNQDLFPAAQFDSQGMPFPRLRELLAVLPKEGWSGVFWLFQPTGHLGGQRPIDVLPRDIEAVVEAARSDFEGNPESW